MFFFRVDSNSTISAGHVIRCLSIASEILKRNEKVCFLVSDENPVSILDKYGIPYVVLNTNWLDLMPEIEIVKSILKKYESPKLIIDTYQITRAYVEELKPFCKIAYLGSKDGYLGELDVLINYSADINYSFYSDNYKKHTNLLLGVAYAPLREEFRKVEHIYHDQIKHILLTTGNTNKDCAVQRIINKLFDIVIKNSNIIIDVVVGGLFENKEEIHKQFDVNPNVRLHENVKTMSFLMKESDLAISANGTTVYELSVVGIPTISFAMVSEQVKSAEALSKLGVVDYCGRFYQDSDICINNIVNRVEHYINNNDDLIDLGKKANKSIDGKGCQRIVNALI